MALPSCRCVGAYPNWKILGPIVAAARTWAGESPNLHCFDNRPIIDQLRGLYCATLTVSGGGGGGGATLLASFYIPEIVDSFERSMAAGYSGNGDPDTFQREDAVDVLRDDHYQSGITGQLVILEDEPTECVLVAPANIEGVGGVAEFDASWDDIPITDSLLRYEWRLDDTGSWTSNDLSTTLTGESAAPGPHVLNVRAISTSGVLGITGDSDSFNVDVDPGAGIAEIAHVSGSGTNTFATAGVNTTGATLIVAVVTSYSGASAPVLTDSKGNSWTASSDYDNGAGLRQTFYRSIPSSVGGSHTFTLTGSTILASIVVIAFSGTDATPYDTISTGSAFTGTSGQPGSVTPSENGSVILVGASLNPIPFASSTSSSPGYTFYNEPMVDGVSFGSSLGFQVQAIAAPENPTVTISSSGDTILRSIVFNPTP